MKAQAKETTGCHECHAKRLPKANELPFYEKCEPQVEFVEKPALILEPQISIVRQHVTKYASFLNDIGTQTSTVIETGVAHCRSSYDYLTDAENKVPRIATTISGGVVGLLLAARRGIFRKLIYASTGTGITFSLLYPSIAKEYAQTALDFSKDKVDTVLMNYAGYDTDKLAAHMKTNMETMKSAMKFEMFTQKLNEWFYKTTETPKDTEKITQDTNKGN